jgi:hypothetical protein
MKRWVGLSLFLIPLLASAASFWDGNAALQRGDATFEAGLFAASNSFQENTEILIDNLDSGKSAKATVVKRIDNQADILVLVSPIAAAALGISQGTLARVRVTLAVEQGGSASSLAESAYSLDPDVNPGAAYGEVEPAASVQQAAAADTQTDTAQQAAPEVEPQASLESLPVAQSSAAEETGPLSLSTPEAPQPEQKAPEQAQTTPTATETPTAPVDQAALDAAAATAAAEAASTAAAEQAAALKAAEDAAIVAAAQARAPQKQVFLPPREDEKFAYQKPAEPPQTAQTTAQGQQPDTVEEPAITSVIGEPLAAPEPMEAPSTGLAEAQAPMESLPEEIVGTDSAAPALEGATAEVAMAVPEPLPEELTPAPQEPVQTDVSIPPVTPASPPAAKMALLFPEAPAPLQASAATAQTTQTAQAAATTTTTQTTQVKTQTTTTTAQTVVPPKAGNGTQVQTTAALSRTGKPDTFYLQLGAFTTEKIAKDLATSLAPTYPALVVAPPAAGARVFRVLLGPLNKAESGTLLTWFRYRGFPDAFVKQE